MTTMAVALQSANQVITKATKQMMVSQRTIEKIVGRGMQLEMFVAVESQISHQIMQSVEAQHQLNESVDKGEKKSRKFLKTFKTVVKYLKQGVEFVTKTSDAFVNSRNRLEQIRDGHQTIDQLQSNIFSAANRARGDYFVMADAVARIGQAEAFAIDDEAIAFTELMQKSFRAGGASQTEQQSGMKQISNSLAMGKISGSDVDLLMQNAPLMAQAIADHMQKPIEQIKKLADEGRVTSEVLKHAMFKSAEEINEKFSGMPKTFEDVFGELKNTALQSFGPVLMKLNELLNSPAVVAFINQIKQFISVIATLAGYLLDGLASMIEFISSNWPTIEAILMAIGFYFLPNIIKLLWAMIPPIITKAIAWLAANWPILLIIGAIALVLLFLSQMGVTAEQILGFIGGLFGTLYAVVHNVVATLWNIFASFAEFIMNVFNDPVYSVKKLFVNLLNSVLDLLKSVAKAMDWVFGTNLAGGITTFQDDLEKWLGEEPEGYKVVQRMEQKSFEDAAKAGYEIGAGLTKEFEDLTAGFTAFEGKDYEEDDKKDIDKVREVGRIRNTVDISSEDIKLMRELAEMRNIQNFVTLTPQVSVQTGDIRETADMNQVISHITNQLTSELESSARGVYE